MRFETEPGYQSQLDFGEFPFERADGTIGKIYLFSTHKAPRSPLAEAGFTPP
jgi:hypothetical protein